MGDGLRRARDAARATRPPTANEISFLTGLAVTIPDAVLSQPGWWSVPGLLRFQPGRFGGRPAEGLHRTGASLVRKGLARKRKTGSKGPVEYQITDAGRAAAGTGTQ